MSPTDTSSRSTSAGLPSVPRWTAGRGHRRGGIAGGGRVETPGTAPPMRYPRRRARSRVLGVVSQAAIVSMTKEQRNQFSSASICYLLGIGRRRMRGRISSRPRYFIRSNRCTEHCTLIGRPASPRPRRAPNAALWMCRRPCRIGSIGRRRNLSFVASGQVDAVQPRTAAAPALSPGSLRKYIRTRPFGAQVGPST